MMQRSLNVTPLRSLLWRLGRKVYCWARREVVNEPHRNGEYWLLDNVVRTMPGESLLLFDVGANIGEWTDQALALAVRAGRRCTVHAFEPAAETHAHLVKRFKDNQSVVTHPLALSNSASTRDFYVVGDLAGTNSLYAAGGSVTRVESVQTTTLDQFVWDCGIERINMVKCDTEGHDFAVLQGAMESLRSGRIDVWQFEYNWRWISERRFLKDVFDLVGVLPYLVGKLSGNGIEIFERWHPELERFFEGNYLLIRKGCWAVPLCKNVLMDLKHNAPRSVCAMQRGGS